MILSPIINLWVGLTHNADGTFSSTKFWQLIGYIISSYIVVSLTMNDNISSEIFLIYIGAITAARSFQNYLSAKGKSNEGNYGGGSYYGSFGGDGRGRRRGSIGEGVDSVDSRSGAKTPEDPTL